MRSVERYRGSLLGLATGDALGTTLEFAAPGSFTPITDMVGGGPFRLRPGQWTDDTSMALCLAESLCDLGRFDPGDQLRRYLRWYREGHLSSTGACFDIGGATREALERFARTGEPYAGSTDPRRSGNGSLMRLAPVPLFFAAEPAAAIERSGESSRTTHQAPEAIDACRYYGGLIAGAVRGEARAALLSPLYAPLPGYWQEHPLTATVAAVAAGSFKERRPPEIRGSGHVVRCLEAALWAFHGSDTFAEGCLLAANLGDDADTTAAVYGQLAGAYYGEGGIPAGWRERLSLRKMIVSLAECLHRLAGMPE